MTWGPHENIFDLCSQCQCMGVQTSTIHADGNYDSLICVCAGLVQRSYINPIGINLL